jgi:hypothetical protein
LSETKPFYLSKTLWINIIAVMALLFQLKLGFLIAPEEQIAILAVINLIVRAITKEELSFTE